jgi:uncharacterized membrane protein
VNETSPEIYFQLTPVWQGVAVLCAVLLVVGFWSYRRTGKLSSARRVLLWGLRVGSVALVLFLLADPHRIDRKAFDETREVAILLDVSQSMALQDTPDQSTRMARARALVGSIQSQSGIAGHLRLYTFGERLGTTNELATVTASESHSRFSEAVASLLNQPRDVPLGAVVLLSDGQFADAAASRESALKLHRAGIPLFAFGFGTPEEAADVVLRGAVGGQIVPFDPKIRLGLTVDSPGFDGRKTMATVRRGGRLLHEQSVTLTGKPQEVVLEFDSPFEGFSEYSVSLGRQSGERLDDNNAGRFGVNLRDEKIRVLYMEGTPGATDTLENALEQDPQMEVTSLYFPQHTSIVFAKKSPYRTDRKGRRVYNVAHPYRGFPTNMVSLLKYDVVINSDIYREAFTPEQLDNTVSLVEQHGGGFVMVGGSTAFGAGQYDKTVIDKLMPVDVVGNRDSEWRSFKLRIPEEAYDHPIMRVGLTADESRRAWNEKFPGFGGLNLVNRLKPGAVSLALHGSKSNQYGPLVVFAVQQIGRGRTMAFTSDTTPGWGASFESRFGTPTDRNGYYRQFWNNAIRWLAADRIQRKTGEIRIGFPAGPVHIGETVPLTVTTLSPYPAAKLTLKLVRPDRTEAELPLESSLSDGSFAASFVAEQTGAHRLVAHLAKAGDENVFARQLVDVIPNQRELASTRANHELLQSLATTTGGRFAAGPSQSLPEGELGDLQAQFVEYRESSTWDRWWLMLLLAALLGTEWSLRRGWGLA